VKLAAFALLASAWLPPSAWDWQPPPSVGGVPFLSATERVWGWQSPVAVRRQPNDYWWSHTWRANLSGYAAPVSDGSANAMVDDPYHYHQWPLSEGYLDMPRAWAVTVGSTDVVVAVADIEFDWRHYDLIGNVAVNEAERGGLAGVDDDGNGLIDDIRGWDTYDWDAETYLPYGSDAIQHGTTMGSILGAMTNNEPWTKNGGSPDDIKFRGGIAGVAWNCRLLPVKYLSDPGSSLAETTNYMAEYIVDQKARGLPVRVVSVSAINESEYICWRLRDAGILLVVGAGNSNNTVVNTASAYPGVVVVGAVSDAYAKSTNSFSSSYGSGVDMVAYSGTGMTGYADRGGFHGTDYDEPIWYPRAGLSRPTFWTLGWHGDAEYMETYSEGAVTFAGNFVNRVEGQRIYGIIPQEALTSGATPQVAGVAALLFSYRPELTPPQVVSMLKRGCRNIDQYNTDQCGGGPCAGLLGAGALSAYRALTLWGAVGDTVLSGDVYISGDVWVRPGKTVTCSPGTRFFVAPDDIYEGDIVDDGAADGVNCYPWLAIDTTEFTNVPASSTPPTTSVYVSGTFDLSGAVMYGWRDSPVPETWGGVYVQEGGAVIGDHYDRVRDSKSGVVEASE